jgi:hypothetical protein
MKYILIRGTKDAGKSTTMNEVCKRLNPNSIKKLKDKKFIECEHGTEIFNDTFLIPYKNKNILIVAGAPTEQTRTITFIISICVELKIEISLALVSMRSSERKEGYDTINELERFGTCILNEQIWQVQGEFKESKEWNERIENILSLINTNI